MRGRSASADEARDGNPEAVQSPERGAVVRHFRDLKAHLLRH